MKNKLIILGFIRKRIFILYLILLVILYSSLLCLNVFLSNLQENKKDNYFNNSLATIHKSTDIYDSLIKNKMIGDVKRVIYLDNVSLHPEIYENLREVRVNDQIVVIEDDNLSDDKIDLYLNEYRYEELIAQISDNDSLVFTINDNTNNFFINKIYSSQNVNYVSVSSNIFIHLMNLSREYDYIFKLYTTDEEVKKELSDLIMLTGTTEDDILIANRLNQHIKVLIIFNFLIGIIFLIVLFVITNNIAHDLEKNIILENLLGFNINEIRKNVIIRLSILNIFSLVLAIFGSIIVLLLINLFYKINIFICNYFVVILLLMIVFISIYYVLMICRKKLNKQYNVF